MQTQGNLYTEIKASVMLAVPMAGAQLAQISMSIVDTMMLGRLSPDALAAGALGHSVYFPFLVLAIGVVTAVNPMVAQAYGAGEIQSIGRTVRQGMWLAVGFAIPTMALLWWIAPHLTALDQAPETVVLATDYLQAVIWGIMPALWFTALRNFADALSRPRPVLVITLIGTAVNVLANYTLIFGNFGFPQLGVEGAGWATTIANMTIFLGMVVYIRGTTALRPYGVFSRLGKPDWVYFRKLLALGWPIGSTFVLEVGFFAGTALLIGTLGPASLGAHQIVIQCASVTFMIPLGVSIATSVQVGQAIGRGDAAAARRAGYIGFGLSTVFMTLAAGAFLAFPRFFVSLFMNVQDAANAEVIGIAVGLFSIAAVFQIVDGIQVTAMGALRGLKDTRAPMLLGFIAYWCVGLGSGYVFGFVLGWNAPGFWWGIVCGLTAAAFLLGGRFMRMVRRDPAEWIPTHPQN